MRKKWYLGVLCLAIVGMLFTGGCMDNKTTVPDVFGFLAEDATIEIKVASLDPYPKKGIAAPEKVLETKVYEQSPVAGTRVPKRSGVEFMYYGKHEVTRLQRVMSILWMGDDKWGKEIEAISLSAAKAVALDLAITWEEGFGGTHVVGFCERAKPDWYEESNVKLIMYLKTDDPNIIRDEVIRWRNHPNLGGYWFISGHEPDITGTEPSFEEHKKLRREIYKLVRRLDPDAWNHPVVIWYNCTGTFAHYPGWQNAFPTPEEGVDCDIFAGDFYANKCDGTTDYEGLERAGNNLVTVGLERSRGQYIPCLGAFVERGCEASSLLEQWEWWVEWYEKKEGEELKAVAFYFSGLGSEADGVYQNERLAREAKEINRRLFDGGRLK